MNVISAIGLESYGPFTGKVRLPIVPGLTAIYGLNRVHTKASKNSNGVGKSLLAGAPAEILYEEPIVGLKVDKLKSGVRSLPFTTHSGKRVLVQRVSNGRSDKLQIKVNGKLQEYRTQTAARDALRRLFPITPEEYSTYVHLDSRIPHPLVMGNNAARKDFFTRFFGLDKIDAERKLYVAELAKLKRVRAAYDELRAQYEKLRTQVLPRDEREALVTRQKRYRRQMKKLQDELSAVQELTRLFEFAAASSQQLKQLDNICHGDICEQQMDRAERWARKELKEVEGKLRDAIRWEQYQEQHAEYEQAASCLSVKARTAIDTYGLAALLKRCARHSGKRTQLQAQIDDLEPRTQRLAEDLKRIKLPEQVTPPAEDEGELDTLKRAYIHQLEHATRFKQGKCETCGQIVKIKDPEVLRQKLDVVKDKLRRHQQARDYEEAVNERRETSAKLKKLKTQLADLQSQLESTNKWERLGAELKELPVEPAPFTGVPGLSVRDQKAVVADIQKSLSLIEHFRPHLETIEQLKKLTAEDKERFKQQHDCIPQLNKVQDQWSRTCTALELDTSIRQQLREIKPRLEEYERQLKEEEALKHLVNGYQDKNLKKMAIEAISQRLMTLVNRFAAPVFPENFKFEFKWDTQIQLLVHRRVGKKVQTSDVRRLSGAESTLFTLVLVCALLAFVPERKRCNVLILDEPSARLSTEMQEVFKNLLTTLNQLIPSIIVITPHNERYEGATAFTVVKRRGESTLVQGYPDQIRD